jgi:hemerythrin-like metal-binding protein
MAIFDWDEKYSVHDMTMDNHHKKLFDILNKLFDEMAKGAQDDKIIEIINELISYTNYHFTEEERMMEREGYPDILNHKQLHKAFVARMEEYAEKSKNGNAIFIVVEVANTGVDWLKSHILTVDSQYDKFIQQKKA